MPACAAVALSNPALLSGSVNCDQHLRPGPGLPDRDSATEQQHQPPGHLAELLRDDGDPAGARPRLHDRDNETAPKVVVINEAAAKKYFPNENPIGQRFGSSLETTGQLEIVGVLRDAKYNSVRDPAPPTMYVPYLQARAGSRGDRGPDRGRSGERSRAASAKRCGRSIRTCR